ncbi:unnamed protein product [Closterium sp. NIES-54]
MQLTAAHAACRHAQPAAASSPQPAQPVVARNLRQAARSRTCCLPPRAARSCKQPAARTPVVTTRSLLLPTCCLPTCLLPAAYLPACCLLPPACCLPAACLRACCLLPAASYLKPIWRRLTF